jgi:hypothetical protein
MVLLIIGGAAVRVVIGDDALAYYKRSSLEDHKARAESQPNSISKLAENLG